MKLFSLVIMIARFVSVFCICAVQSAATVLPVRQLQNPCYNLTEVHACPRSLLKPGGASTRIIYGRKPQLPIGGNGDDITPYDDFVESISPELRIEILKDLWRCARVVKLQSLPYKSDIAKWYIEYARSSMYIEAGVIRLLYRYALGMLKPEESHINSATSMNDYLQHYFVQHHNYRLHHVTPRILSQWYALIGDNRRFRINASRELIKRNHLPDIAIVSLELYQWQVLFIESRIARLRTSGYETQPI